MKKFMQNYDNSASDRLKERSISVFSALKPEEFSPNRQVVVYLSLSQN